MRFIRVLLPVASLYSVLVIDALAKQAVNGSTAVTIEISAPVYPGIPTKTVISTYTSTFAITLWQYSRTESLIDHITRTAYQPGPFPTSALPTTVTIRFVSNVLQETRITNAPLSGPADEPSVSGTLKKNWSGTGLETWVLHTAAPTHLPAAPASKLPCDTCRSSLGLPPPPADPACESHGLATACQVRQCDLVDGAYWCLFREYRDSNWLPGMGRVCWGGNLHYMQLLSPCVVGDYDLGCTECKGYNYSYQPYRWIGPGTNLKGDDD